MFCKQINLEPNTPYRIKCKVKTLGVESTDDTLGGAQICITDTIEKSMTMTGDTEEWQELEFMFNSKDRTSVEIAFRLGGYNTTCSGIAWFTDFTMEKGELETSNNWKYACVAFPNLDVELEINGVKQNFKFEMTDSDISDMKKNMQRFQNSISELTNGKITATYDFFTVNETIRTLSYDDENGYYVSPDNIEKILYPYIANKGYDYIFICVRMGDANQNLEIPVNDWIGLGGMDYLGIGFSNIRLPNSDKSYIYKYNDRINTFPEEVFVHEFIHTLERNAQEYGNNIIELHDYSKYGYNESKKEGLKQWYYDYMNKNVEGNLGLPEEVFTIKPVKQDNFKNGNYLDEFREPQNFIEEIQMILDQIKLLFKEVEGEEELT